MDGFVDAGGSEYLVSGSSEDEALLETVSLADRVRGMVAGKIEKSST
jgi:hypothetical protein